MRGKWIKGESSRNTRSYPGDTMERHEQMIIYKMFIQKWGRLDSALIGLRDSTRQHFSLRVSHGVARDQVTGWTGKGRNKGRAAAVKKDIARIETSSLDARDDAEATTQRLACELDALAIDLRESYGHSRGCK